MNVVKKVIRRLRHQRKPEKRRDTSMDWLIDIRSKQYRNEFWERDKKIVRDQNFKKALLVREDNVRRRQVEREAEAKRQDEISETRMKNLKKARRRLRWLRKQGANNEQSD